MNKTIWFIIAAVTAITIYDVWVIDGYGNEESISAHLLSMGEVIPQITLLLGYTFGHLTFPRKISSDDKDNLRPYSYAFFAVVGYMAVIDVYQVYWGQGLEATIFGGKEFNHPVVFIVGYILGHFLWAMPEKKWKGRFK